MAMIKCKECGAQVSNKAEKCPQCGAPVPKIGIIKGVGIVLGAIFLVGTCSALMSDKEPAQASSTPAAAPRPAQAAPQPAPAPQPVAEVTATAITKEYEDNELRGDAAYKGKLIRVKGKVGDVAKDIMGGAYVTVGSGSDFEVRQVQCMLAKGQEGKAMNLGKGTPVTVVGTVSGLMMNVLLDDCVIE